MRNQTQNKVDHSLLISVFVFSVFVNLLMLTGPLFMLQVYDRVLNSRSEATLVALFILVAGLYLLMGVLDYARGRLMARFAVRFRERYDRQVFTATISGAQAHDTPTAGLRDLDAVQAFLTAPVMIALFDIPWTPIFLGTIFIFHPLLGWLAFAGGMMLVIATVLNNRLTQQRTLQAQQQLHQAHLLAEQTRIARDFVRSQGMIKSMAHRWNVLQHNASEQHVLANDWIGWFSAFTKAFRLFLQSAMLALGAWLSLNGELSAGAMIAGTILLGRALAPIEQSIGQWGLFQRACQSWRTIGAFTLQGSTEPLPLTLPTPSPTLSFQGVTVFAPNTKRPSLSGVSFAVGPGQVLGVIGNSGMGKSTLAKAIVGLAPAVSGDIRFGGATLDQYDPAQLGSLIGYLPQDVTLFDGTVAENIARMAITPDDAKVFQAAKRANAHEMILSLPEGYQTKLDGNDSSLSGGQKQRLALARALYSDPILLVLDEPNSALDSLGTYALNQTVRKFREANRAVIVMTHRPLAIGECDRLIVLEHGRIKANGPRDDVLQAMVQNADDIKQVANGGHRAA